MELYLYFPMCLHGVYRGKFILIIQKCVQNALAVLCINRMYEASLEYEIRTMNVSDSHSLVVIMLFSRRMS